MHIKCFLSKTQELNVFPTKTPQDSQKFLIPPLHILSALESYERGTAKREHVHGRWVGVCDSYTAFVC